MGSVTYNMNSMTPRLQLSTTLSYPSVLSSNTSGAAKAGVPHLVFDQESAWRKE